jgi:RNA polymerase sigma-70 factor (ECF subfamily)
MPSSPRNATVTSTPWSRCSTRMSLFESTRAPCPPAHRRRSEPRSLGRGRGRLLAVRPVQPARGGDGTVGVIVAPRGRLFRALRFGFKDGRIAQVHVVADPERLRQLELGVLDG